jgi:hypothetical protein
MTAGTTSISSARTDSGIALWERARTQSGPWIVVPARYVPPSVKRHHAKLCARGHTLAHIPSRSWIYRLHVPGFVQRGG